MSEQAVENGARPEWWRVTFTHGALTKVNRARRRFRCEGHIADVEHFIEPGQRYVRTSLPPNHSEINNDDWWHMRFCMACCPESFATPAPHPTDSDARALQDTQAEAGETGDDDE